MERPLLHQMVRTHGWAGLAEDSAASPGISTRGDPPTPSFHKEGTGKGKCDPEAPPLTGHNARCGGSHRCPGAGLRTRRLPVSRRQGPRTPTSHLGGRGRNGTQSERLWPPRPVCGSRPRAAASRGRPSWGIRGVSAQGKDPGPPRSRRSHSRSPPNSKNPIRSSSSSSAAAPSARGRPRGSMAGCGGTQGGARPRAAGSIAGPADPGGREEAWPWAAGPDGRPVPSRPH